MTNTTIWLTSIVIGWTSYFIMRIADKKNMNNWIYWTAAIICFISFCAAMGHDLR